MILVIFKKACMGITQEADGLVYAYLCNFGSKTWGQRSMGFEGFSWVFNIYIC